MQNLTLTMSMYEKNYYKRRINREHGSNLRAGYVCINEEHLHKTGLRGRKICFLFLLVSFLILLTLVNVGATGVLLYVLRVSTEGVRGVQFGSLGEVQFTKTTGLDDVVLVQNKLEDIGQGLAIHAVDNSVMLLSDGHGPKLQVGSEGVEVLDVESFQVVDPVSGRRVFDTDNYSLPASLNSLSVEQLQLTEINSPGGKDLTLFTEGGDMTVTGSTGVIVKGKRVEVSAQNALLIDVESLSLSSPGGVYLDDFDHMTQVSADPVSQLPVEESYQLCICVQSGLLFTSPVGVRCDVVNEAGTPHPCDM